MALAPGSVVVSPSTTTTGSNGIEAKNDEPQAASSTPTADPSSAGVTAIADRHPIPAASVTVSVPAPTAPLQTAAPAVPRPATPGSGPASAAAYISGAHTSSRSPARPSATVVVPGSFGGGMDALGGGAAAPVSTDLSHLLSTAAQGDYFYSRQYHQHQPLSNKTNLASIPPAKVHHASGGGRSLLGQVRRQMLREVALRQAPARPSPVPAPVWPHHQEGHP